MLNPIGKLRRTYRHVARWREITRVLLKHGFGEFASKTGLRRRFHRFRRRSQAEIESERTLTRHARIRLALEELGPTFVKLGQMLRTRTNIVPPELVTELEKLQDAVHPFTGDEAWEILSREYGGDPGARLAGFERVPIASASIAQVHEARTLDGARIVLKIQRPNIARLIEVDLEIMAELAALTERFVHGAAVLQLGRLVQEFGRSIRRELDFALEANNMEQFAGHFAGDRTFHVPAVRRELCTPRVLAMEYAEGVKVTNFEELAALGLDRRVIAERGSQILLRQVFEFGLFHADPHPGNVLILPGNVICLLDYGSVGILSERHRELLGNLIIGFASRDEARIAHAFLQMAGYTGFERTEEVETDITSFLQDNLYRPLHDIHIGRVLGDLTRLLVRHNIRMPPGFFLLIRSLTTLEGVGRLLVPDFDLLHYAAPSARRLLRDRLRPGRLLHELFMSALETRGIVRDFPFEVRQVMAMVKQGTKVRLRHEGLEEVRRSNDQISNRIVFAIVLAALIVGSSLLVLSGLPPKWHEVPVIGLGGVVVSGLMGFWLLYSILKHGRM